MANQLTKIDLLINAAKAARDELNNEITYSVTMAHLARKSLSEANRSGDKFRKAAAMRAINYFAKKEHSAIYGMGA